jgi:hypothetical protein
MMPVTWQKWRSASGPPQPIAAFTHSARAVADKIGLEP